MSPQRSAKVWTLASRKRGEQKFALTIENRWYIGLALLLVVLIVSAYRPALLGGFIWDDDAHLTANPCIVGPLGFKEIWTTPSATYYPLVLTSFWIQHAVWGLNPFFFHMVNVVVHALSALLLWRVLLHLEVPGAWLGAALWALHPVQVESVAWITELKNTQSCFFYLLTILFFLKWRTSVRAGRGAILDYGLVVLFAVLAILSKSSTVILPVVLALCWWWKERRLRWRDALWLSPFVIVSAAASAWTIWEQKFHAGATGEEWAQRGLERLAIAGKAVWFYSGKLVWPHPLIFIYPRWQIDVSQTISLLPAASAILLWVALWLGRDKTGLRPVFFALSYFLIALFPVMGFFNVYFFRYSFVGDHFQYLASIGLIALVPAAFRRSPKPLPMVPVVLLLVLLVLTRQQTKIYRDQETLWRDTLAKNPTAWIAHTILANDLRQQGKLPEAIQHYEQTLQLRPDDADAHNNLGLALAGQGKQTDAIQHYSRALQLKPENAEAHNNLAITLATQGNFPEATQHYQRALQLKPDFAAAHDNLGTMLASEGNLPEAIQHYDQALQLKPDFAQAYYNRGNALAHDGNLAEAIQDYEQAIHFKPDYAEALANLGGALAVQGKLSEAQQRYEEALKLKPDDGEIYYNLAGALAGQGKVPEAILNLKRGLDLAVTQQNAALAEAIRARLSSCQQALSTSQTP